MREIKFRVWDKLDNCWATDFTIDLDGSLLCDNGSTLFIRDNFILLQYTGLKDNTGKEIYDGDIILYGILKYEIKFFNGAFRIYHKNFYYGILESEKSKDFEIIGNIYENPELLEQSNV